MAALEYGAAYAPARCEEDNRVSMSSVTNLPRQSQYQAYRPVHQRNVSAEETTSQPHAKANRSSDSSDSLYASPKAGSSEDGTPKRAPSWIISAIDLQKALPPQSAMDTESTPQSPGMRPSIFGTRDTPQEPYQESVAWANSTDFNPAISQNPPIETFGKQEGGPTVSALQERDTRRDSRQYFRHPRRILEPWKTGFWRRFPFWGFASLLIILLLTGTSAGIILASNGKTADDWKIGGDNTQPQVYISICEMVMNFLAMFALLDGMVIRFWRQMLHGITLSAMHDTFESIHLWSAIKRVVTMRYNKVAVACVFVASSFIRGPLFQRALTLSPVTQTYTTHPIFVAIGIFLSFASVLATMPLYFGFWELGRTVSLNPLEIAKAFGAPLLKGLDGNATPDMITVERGGMSVKYGALERYPDSKDLRVEEMSRAAVRTPWQDEIFG
ncbi:hypothetical protein P280DRAFT_546780 [Massarina eburnea CBS 473.64]|uniref:Uncharacterized protein n=1 Tax=Massarina eburnea CBS 473.64 TaxID=1395130 RepID=A0A6A6SAN2_9PLEO|nr:hypothetical protein P280DRAFT_546780 [Massarina eburnea CBS 473.64]